MKIILIVLTILFIIIMVIKRFVYFLPSYEFIPPKTNFIDIYKGNLHAWYKKGSSSKVILYCHGNKGNISHCQDKIIEFLKTGVSVLVFDYSGFGQSKGVPSEELLCENASTFLNHLLGMNYKKEDIILYGEHIGAFVALHVAIRYGLKKVILDSILPSMGEIMTQSVWLKKLTKTFFNDFNTGFLLGAYKGEILDLQKNSEQNINDFINK